MSMFDSLKDQAMSHVGGENAEVAQGVFGMFGNSQSSGLMGLVRAFQERGLGGAVSSWVGTGQNQSVSPEQIESVVGKERLEKMASRFGMSPETVSEKLSQVLPMVVDRLTPNGHLPQE